MSKRIFGGDLMPADPARNNKIMLHPPNFHEKGLSEHSEHTSLGTVGMLVEDPSPIMLELVQNSVDIKVIAMDLPYANHIMREGELSEVIPLELHLAFISGSQRSAIPNTDSQTLEGARWGMRSPRFAKSTAAIECWMQTGLTLQWHF